MALFRGESTAVALYGNPDSAGNVSEPGGKLPQGPQVLQPGQQETMFRGYQPSNASTVRDRHIIINRGTEKTGRPTDQGDPMKDGPPRPSYRMIDRSFYPMIGTDATRNQDDLTRGYREDRQGEWVGTQDGSVTRVYGGVPGLYQPYGSYGGYTTGPVKGIQSPAAYGSPQDVPQTIPASPPHGLHSATFPDYSQTLGRYMATNQQTAGRVDRPSNSPIAGQSYSQTVAPQGQIGVVANPIRAGRTIPVTPGQGWRGA